MKIGNCVVDVRSDYNNKKKIQDSCTKIRLKLKKCISLVNVQCLCQSYDIRIIRSTEIPIQYQSIKNNVLRLLKNN